VTRPGKYQVTAVTASQGTGNYHVSIGNQKLSGTAPNTGDYSSFQSTQLAGALEISTPGIVTLEVKPVAENWSPMNLKLITLTPVANN
jgi:hypothetical protein